MNYLILFGAMIGMFYKAMYCGYVVDDVNRIPSMRNSKRGFKERKMPFMTFASEALYGGGLFGNAKYEYLFTLTVHYINCSLIYHMTGSLLASLLYLCNPVNNQTALWMNGRRYALSILAVLLAWNFKFMAIILFPFIAWIHVSGLALPLLFLTTKQWWVVPVCGLIGFFIAKDMIIAKIKSRKSEFIEGNENQRITPKKLILFVKTIGYNFIHCLFPLKPAMYHNFLADFSGSQEAIDKGYSINADFFKGVGVITLLGYLMIAQHNFWALWFVLFTVQWCNLYQVTMNTSDRYCSLANVGVMVGLSQYLMMLPDPYRTASITAFFVLYFLKYQPLFRAYTSVENFHLYHLDIQPDLVNPRYFLAKYYLQHNDVYSAFAIIKKGLKFRPYDFKFLLTMMECLFALGKVQPAFKVMAVAEKHIPLNEEGECNVLFAKIREQYAKQLKDIEAKDKLHARHIHNGGQPIVGKPVNKNKSELELVK